jgi:hypothetical protein
MEYLDKGRECVAGGSQARALTVTTTLGGKAGWAPAAWLLFEALESAFEEALSPFADDLARRVEARGDLVIPEALRC